jgi:glycerol-3-phosphate acyltransferase PlsY
MPALSLAAIVAGGYFVGSIPTAFWLTKLWKGVDIRVVGSGNSGATNVLRAIGPLPSLLVFLLDVGKGVLGVELGWALLHQFPLAAIMGGLAAVAGHNWSFWLGFRGGKGVATSLGLFLALSPAGALLALAVFIVVVAVTRYVSLGSLLGSLALPSYLLSRGQTGDLLIFSLLAAALIFYRHRSNMARLWAGTESRFTLKGQAAFAKSGSLPPNPEGRGEFPG